MNRTECLDKGYLELVNYMGDESAIIESARMSTSGSFVSWEPYDKHPKGDAGLLSYLWRNEHLSPFEMCELVFEVKAPIFVARQWMRHRAFSYNEHSARYSEMPAEYYVPKSPYRDVIEDSCEASFAIYHDLLKNYVPRETARMVLPVSTYTKFRVKGNLRNWFAFLKQRLDAHAQYEIRVYAEAVLSYVKELYPRTTALFLEGLKDDT